VLGGIGSMKDRRRVNPDISGASKAGQLLTTLHGLSHLFDWNPPKPMRTKSNQQWRIFAVASIQVRANCHHSLNVAERGLDVNDARLFRPRTEARAIYLFANGDCAVLVPAKCPINGGTLIE
jgi:hypothetical protein